MGTFDWRISRITASENSYLGIPDGKINQLLPLILAAPQANGDSSQFADPGNNGYTLRATLFEALVQAGFTVIGADFGGANLFGNATAQSRVKAAYDFGQTLSTVKTGMALGLGVSMGGCTLANFNTQYNLLKGCCNVVGTVDTNDVYANNLGGLQATVGTAWGVTFPTPLPTAASPINNVSTLPSGYKWLGLYDADDPLIRISTAQAYQAALLAKGLTDVTLFTNPTGGHADAPIGTYQISTVVNWFKRVAVAA